MPVIKCRKCGGTTNTAVSENLYKMVDNYATECYAKWENGKWVKGCAYDKANEYNKPFVDKLINEKG